MLQVSPFLFIDDGRCRNMFVLVVLGIVSAMLYLAFLDWAFDPEGNHRRPLTRSPPARPRPSKND